MIGAKLPPYSRIWRNLAEMEGSPKLSYALSGLLCNAPQVPSVPQSKSAGMYHFRTPSSGGQHPFSNTLLPAIFSASVPRLAQADLCPPRQFDAHLTPRFPQRLTCARYRLSTRKTSIGKTKWAPNTSRFHALQRLALQLAETPRANRPSSAARSAQARLPLRVAALRPALRLVLRATFWRASSTSSAANAHAFQHLTSQNRRRASLHGGVLHFLPNSSEGPCSKSF